KQCLPYNPKELKLKGKYTFPITETGEITVFLNEPDLIDFLEQITHITIQVPIVTTKALVEMARELRKIYFFRQILSEP
ncbi:21631_t:CDS:2, partial [Gigaspora rosea]